MNVFPPRFEKRARRIVLSLLLSAVITTPLLVEARGTSRHSGGSDEPTISLTVLTEKPHTIGDPIDIALTINHGKNERIDYPEDKAYFQPFLLRGIKAKTERSREGSVKTLVIYTITPFQTGNLTLNGLSVRVGDRSLTTDALVIPILSVLPKDEENPPLKDIVAPYRARIKPLTIVLVLVSLAAAFVLFLFISRFIENRIRTSVPYRQAPRPIDPYRYALDTLQLLKNNRGEYSDRDAYSQISHCLKLYFGYVLNRPVPEMTTRQIKQTLRRSSVEGGSLLTILQRSDLVKFARENPGHAVLDGDIEGSIRLITETHRRHTAENETDTGPADGDVAAGDDDRSVGDAPAASPETTEGGEESRGL